MSDDISRRLDDLEKRIARLERAAEKPEVYYGGPANHSMFGKTWRQTGPNTYEQWCECGRDVCRAPDCPSHKPDPLGR